MNQQTDVAIDEIIVMAIQYERREAELLREMKAAYAAEDRDRVFSLVGQLCGMVAIQ